MRYWIPLLLSCCTLGCAPSYGAHPFFNLVGDALREAPRFAFFTKDQRRFKIYYHSEGCYDDCKAWEQILCSKQEQGEDSGLSLKQKKSDEAAPGSGGEQAQTGEEVR